MRRLSLDRKCIMSLNRKNRPTRQEEEQAWFDFMDSLDNADPKLVEAIRSIQRFEDEVACPYCSEYNHVTALPDEEVEVTCIGCSGVFNSNLVQYLTAEGI